MSHVVCSLASLMKFELVVVDVTGAFLQGLPIQRELCFRLPKNLGRCSIPRVSRGSLLKLNKSICGTNDAARAWYPSIRSVLLGNGWEALVFEPASFVMRDSQRNLLAVMIVHVDDFLMAIRPNVKGTSGR